jgi:hypothetical protein
MDFFPAGISLFLRFEAFFKAFQFIMLSTFPFYDLNAACQLTMTLIYSHTFYRSSIAAVMELTLSLNKVSLNQVIMLAGRLKFTHTHFSFIFRL